MGKVWVLDTETKGTGANVVPLEKALSREAPPAKPLRRRPKPSAAAPARPRKPKRKPEVSAGPLPPGQVRKRATGELGRVLAVDAKAGTAQVHWLRSGRTSSVPLSAISRR
jgi:hypothetical protein